MNFITNLILLLISCVSSFYLFFKIRDIFKPNIYDGVQKIHDGYVPRVGGLILFIFTLMYGLFNDNYIFQYFCLSSITLFFITIKEDLFHNVRARTRLIFCCISIVTFLLITNFDFPYINFYFLNFINDYFFLVSIFFIFSLLVLINGCNMIDGSNGLLNFTALCILINLSLLDHNQIFHAEIYTLIYFHLTFMLFNFPMGKIFLGDSGAYLIGFILGIMTIQVINVYNLNPYLAIFILIYPCFEVLFSIIRKYFYEKISPLNPDPYHIHLKIYSLLLNKFDGNKFIANNLTTVLLSPVYVFPLLAFMIFGVDTDLLFFEIIFFVVLYLIIYTIVPRSK